MCNRIWALKAWLQQSCFGKEAIEPTENNVTPRRTNLVSFRVLKRRSVGLAIFGMSTCSIG
jgi:hypothetical protein